MNGSVTRYEIRTPMGELVAVHCRQGSGPDKSVWWELPDGTLGLGGMPLVDLPLYGAERLGDSPLAVVCEGEKAAAALLASGVPAVGTVTGAASCPGPDALALLAGREVYLWPDNDHVGAEHMARIGNALDDLAAVFVIRWPGAPEHGDAADYMAAGLDPWRLIDSAQWSAVVDAIETVRACRAFYGPSWRAELPATVTRCERLVYVDVAEAATVPELASALDLHYGRDRVRLAA
jgi:hypothetical protein